MISKQLDQLPFRYFPPKTAVLAGTSGFTRFVCALTPERILCTENILKTALLELLLLTVRVRAGFAYRRFRNKTDLLVNIAAGRGGRADWINVDVFKFPGINCQYDCRKSLPFADGSVKVIFCEHFLEHLDYAEEVPRFLGECWRVLKTGGLLRVVVPDAERYLHAYVLTRGLDEFQRLRPLDHEMKDLWSKCKYNTPMEVINVLFRQGGEHKFAYDFETLELALAKCGFSRILRKEFLCSEVEDAAIDSPSRACESLYAEAIK